MNFQQLLKTWLLLAIGVTIAAHTATGISYDGTGALVVAVLLLSVCNLVLKPLLMLFSLPFIILTFGLGIWLINALLFLLVGALVEGFQVLSFWNALWGAFVVSLTSAIATMIFGKTRVNVQTNSSQGAPRRQPQTRKPLNDDDVIDI
ncbi:MAG: phage holin family protein [Opitutales bacterium]